MIELLVLSATWDSDSTEEELEDIFSDCEFEVKNGKIFLNIAEFYIDDLQMFRDFLKNCFEEELIDKNDFDALHAFFEIREEKCFYSQDEANYIIENSISLIKKYYKDWFLSFEFEEEVEEEDEDESSVDYEIIESLKEAISNIEKIPKNVKIELMSI